MIDCEIPGCSCIEFSAHVTGPAGVTTPPEPPAGPKPITNVDGLRITGLTEEEAESFMAAIAEQRAPVGPPDLHQAIQAATTALCDQHPAIGLADPWAQVARIAVETAAPVLLQATRDRHADLEVYAAELRDLLEQAFNDDVRPDPRGRRELVTKVQAALQVDGPARGQTILAENERLRRGLRALLDHHASEDAWPGSPLDIARQALDQAAQREVDR
jgi:hypothetical protein